MEEADKKHRWISDLEGMPHEDSLPQEKAAPMAARLPKQAEAKARALVQTLRKIPLLVGLEPAQIQKVLNICTLKTYEPEASLIAADRPSDEMFILLSGELAVLTRDALRVATLKPITTVGEMGIIVRHPPSVSIEVVQPSQIFAVAKDQFDAVLKADPAMQSRVYRNLIAILSSKLIHENVRVRDYLLEKENYEASLAASERRLEVALELLAAGQALDREQATAAIDRRLQEATRRVLIVDDEADIRQLLSRVLDQFTVFEAADGQEALDLAARESLDLVITDIRMPRMDGITLLEKLREAHPELPVVGISGYVDAQAVDGRGFDEFITKPVPLRQLRQMVESRLN